MGKGYDNNRVMDETRERGCVPIVCLRSARGISPAALAPWASMFPARTIAH